jgi:hypothetical protein
MKETEGTRPEVWHHQCQARLPKTLFTLAEGEYIADFLARCGALPEVRKNPLLQRFRTLKDSVGAKVDRGERRDTEIAELMTLSALVLTEAKRLDSKDH